MSRSLKSALATVALVVALGLSSGTAAVTGGTFHPAGGATGCCRSVV